LGGSDTGLEPQ